MSKTSKLKPCPFCGIVPKLQDSVSEWTDQKEFTVACFKSACPANPDIGIYNTEAKAVKFWNTRGGKK